MRHEETGNNPELTVQIVQLACPEFTEGFNRFPPFKTFTEIKKQRGCTF
jgi:hypothetical protein